MCCYFIAIIRDVVQKRFEVYNKLEEAARLAFEQEAAAKAAEERKKAEEMAAKAEEAEKTEADKPEDNSVAGEEGGSEPAPTADTPAESGQNEPAEEAETEQE